MVKELVYISRKQQEVSGVLVKVWRESQFTAQIPPIRITRGPDVCEGDVVDWGAVPEHIYQVPGSLCLQPVPGSAFVLEERSVTRHGKAKRNGGCAIAPPRDALGVVRDKKRVCSVKTRAEGDGFVKTGCTRSGGVRRVTA